MILDLWPNFTCVTEDGCSKTNHNPSISSIYAGFTHSEIFVQIFVIQKFFFYWEPHYGHGLIKQRSTRQFEKNIRQNQLSVANLDMRQNYCRSAKKKKKKKKYRYLLKFHKRKTHFCKFCNMSRGPPLVITSY